MTVGLRNDRSNDPRGHLEEMERGGNQPKKKDQGKKTNL